MTIVLIHLLVNEHVQFAWLAIGPGLSRACRDTQTAVPAIEWGTISGKFIIRNSYHRRTGRFTMLQIRLPLTLLMIILVLGGCAGRASAPEDKIFQHEFGGPNVPWTARAFDNEAGKFTFAIFSDLTGGEREGVFALAVEQLRLLRPEFMIGVGDLIDGVGDDEQALNREWESFDGRANRARAPLFHVGGNHDLSGPALWKVWEDRYARRYYHFIYKNVLFLVLDTEDNPPEFQRRMYEIRNEAIQIFEADGHQAFLDSEYGRLQERKSGRISSEQADYFQGVIAAHPQVRWTFLLMHKPAWQRNDEENFSRIESALAERPYTVFHGHVHSYLYTQRLGRDYIRLGTTGGSHAPGDPMAIDHVTMVTVDEDSVDIANIRMSGIFDKSGKPPLNGEELCLEGCN